MFILLYPGQKLYEYPQIKDQVYVTDESDERDSEGVLKCTSQPTATSQKHPSDVCRSNLMTIQQDATPVWTKRIGEDSLAPVL